jgi:hypothetical protein
MLFNEKYACMILIEILLYRRMSDEQRRILQPNELDFA